MNASLVRDVIIPGLNLETGDVIDLLDVTDPLTAV